MPQRKAETITEELPFVSDMAYPEIEVKGREDEIRNLTEVLYRRRMQNCVLVGPPGVGKTAIVREVARRLADTYKFVSLDTGALEAGTDLRGTFENKILQLVAAARRYENNYNKKVVVFIDEIHTICTAGALRAKETELTAANMLKPYISEGKLTVWGATTVPEYAMTIGRDKALMRRLPPVLVSELSRENVIEILKKFSDGCSGVTDRLIEYVYSCSEEISGINPDKSIDILDRAMAKKKLFGKFINWADAVNAAKSDVKRSKEAVEQVMLSGVTNNSL